MFRSLIVNNKLGSITFNIFYRESRIKQINTYFTVIRNYAFLIQRNETKNSWSQIKTPVIFTLNHSISMNILFFSF